MNTYEQDVDVPIYISLAYEHYFLKFPINPESIKKEVGSSSTVEEIEGLGQISIPNTPDLAKIMIESFFWQEVNAIPSLMYVNWLQNWQKSKKPANLVVTRLNYSMQVTCERFDYEIRAGEEADVYFSLDLQEYRPHQAKKIGVKTNTTLLQKVQKITDALGEVTPFLCDIPLPTRNSIKKESFTNPYICKQNETLSSITRKITGSSDDWKSLYDANKSKLSDMFVENDQIPENTSLTLSESWVNNSSYGIIQEAG